MTNDGVVMKMPYFGCHLSPSGGYAAMVCTAVSLGADTVQFFTRNPRGSRAQSPGFGRCSPGWGAHGGAGLWSHCGPWGLYHEPMHPDPEARAFAAQVLTEDLERTTLLPGCLYNFHPGSHVGQGLQEGVRQIAAWLWRGPWPQSPRLVSCWRPWRAKERKSAAGFRSCG